MGVSSNSVTHADCAPEPGRVTKVARESQAIPVASMTVRIRSGLQELLVQRRKAFGGVFNRDWRAALSTPTDTWEGTGGETERIAFSLP